MLFILVTAQTFQEASERLNELAALKRLRILVTFEVSQLLKEALPVNEEAPRNIEAILALAPSFSSSFAVTSKLLAP